MTEVKLSFKDGKWVEDLNSPFQLPIFLKENLDKIKKIQKKDFDAVLIFDGMERAGKSTLAIMCGWYLSDCKLTLNNFARGLKDAAKKIQDLPDGSVLIMDEGSLVFNSKSAMSKEQVILGKLMDVVGQKNLVFIICLPDFFDLSKPIATRRSKFLVNVGVDREYNRGSIRFWPEGKKDVLYRLGKKKHNDHNVIPPNWYAHFTPWYPTWYEDYKEIIKRESLQEVFEEAIGQQNKKDLQKTFLYNIIRWLNEDMNIKMEEIANKANVNYDIVKKWKSIYKEYE